MLEDPARDAEPELYKAIVERDTFKSTAWWHARKRRLAEIQAQRLRFALEEIVKREARSEYTSIYAAPGEFAQIAREALAVAETEAEE